MVPFTAGSKTIFLPVSSDMNLTTRDMSAS
jgi:hypothetical protein